jgi:hypothetical protein
MASTGTTPKTSTDKTSTSTEKQTASSRLSMIDQLQRSMLDLDLANSDDLREFCEAIRKLLHFLGVTVAMAAGQMKVHARRAAREASDGGLTVKQRIVLRSVLRKVGKKLDAVADDCGDGAAESVAAWSYMDNFIQAIEEGGTGRPSRARRGGRGSGFTVNRGGK